MNKPDRFEQSFELFGQRNTRLLLGSWNIGGVKTPAIHTSVLDRWIGFSKDQAKGTSADIYVFNFQEFRDINAPLTYLPEHVERKLQRRLSDRLGREESLCQSLDHLLIKYTRLVNERLVGLHTFIYVSNDFLSYHRLNNVAVAKQALGMLEMVGNKGSIMVALTIDLKRILLVNVHLTAGKGKDKFESRMKQISQMLHYVTLDGSFVQKYDDPVGEHRGTARKLEALASIFHPRHRKRRGRLLSAVGLTKGQMSTEDHLATINDSSPALLGRRSSLQAGLARLSSTNITERWMHHFDYVIMAGDFNFRGCDGWEEKDLVTSRPDGSANSSWIDVRGSTSMTRLLEAFCAVGTPRVPPSCPITPTLIAESPYPPSNYQLPSYRCYTTMIPSPLGPNAQPRPLPIEFLHLRTRNGCDDQMNDDRESKILESSVASNLKRQFKEGADMTRHHRDHVPGSTPRDSSLQIRSSKTIERAFLAERWEADEFKNTPRLCPKPYDKDDRTMLSGDITGSTDDRVHPILHFCEAHEVKPKRIVLSEGTDFSEKPNMFLFDLTKAKRLRPPFPRPTYKWVPSQGVLDSDRVPAWTDRIILASGYGTIFSKQLNHQNGAVIHCAKYSAISDIQISDHIPICAKFNIFSAIDFSLVESEIPKERELVMPRSAASKVFGSMRRRADE